MILLYRILTYILLPFALLFGILGLFAFFVALGNPALFLGVFMLAAFCIYTFCSLRFLQNGVLGQQPLPSKLRDWIKVNAYVSLPFAIINLLQTFSIITKPSLLKEAIKQMLEMQQQMGLPPQPAGTYDHMLLVLIYVMFVFAIFLFVHLQLSLFFLKKFKELFNTAESRPKE